MPKICIMCDNPAGAGEHTFPAAMAGRRTNRQIYCPDHEKSLGPLVANLSDQLKLFHALLNIRHDRKDAAEPFEYTMPDGAKLVAFDGEVRWADPRVLTHSAPHTIPNTFGGPAGLKTVAYMALNMFAQYFQDDVRKEGLKGIKRYLLEDVENDYVWWERDELSGRFPPNKFTFGHTFVLMTSAESGTVRAYVSLFQCMGFGIDLGQIENARDRSVIVFIDPQAERAPEDLVFSTHDELIFSLIKPDPLYKYLKEMIENGAGQDSFQIFMNKVQRWKFGRDMLPAIAALNKCRSMDQTNRSKAVETFIERQTQRIFTLMRRIVGEFIESCDLNEDPNDIILKIMAKMIEQDPDEPEKLTDFAYATTMHIMTDFVDRITIRLNKADLDIDYMSSIFSTREGLRLIAKVMMAPIPDMTVAVKAGIIKL